MPASRSRTERWREILTQISARGGGIEFSVARHADATPESVNSSDLMWRVKLLHVGENDLLVENPAAAGRQVPIAPGTPLVAVMSVGQNRWIFHTQTAAVQNRPGALVLQAPQNVERCFRRDFLRVSTAELHLPTVTCYPLLSASSVTVAEAANRERIRALQESPIRLAPGGTDDTLPLVGPSFSARLMNISGGGLGLLVGKDEAVAAANCKLMWLRLDLAPQIPAPLGVTAKQAHTHLDHEQNLYVGVAFEFAFNPSHRDFVVEQITRYAGLVQGARRAA